jgi:hypothetical protein
MPFGGANGQFVINWQSSAYLEGLMKAGEQSMKQFDESIAAAIGVGASRKAGQSSPFFNFPRLRDGGLAGLTHHCLRCIHAAHTVK